MRLRFALVASIAVHAALAAALGTIAPARPQVAAITGPARPATVELQDVTPIDVIVLPAPAPVPVPAPLAVTPEVAPAPASPLAAAAPRGGSMGTGAASSAPPAEVAPGPAAPSGAPGLLSMRRPGDGNGVGATPALGQALARIAENGKPLPTDPTTGEIKPAGGGEGKHRETVFTARVARDGSVDFEDARNFQWHFALPKPQHMAQALGDHLQSWAEDPAKMWTRPGERPPPDSRPNDEVVTDHDIVFEAKAPIPVAGGSFDLTDWAVRQAGGDPYAPRKLGFLDRTRDERAAMGMREKQRQLDTTEQTVRRYLAWLWAQPIALAEKKETLFAMWDECAETGEPMVVEGGVRARKQIVAFVRAHLPADGSAAFTAAELDRLNAGRSSKAKFAPYD